MQACIGSSEQQQDHPRQIEELAPKRGADTHRHTHKHAKHNRFKHHKPHKNHGKEYGDTSRMRSTENARTNQTLEVESTTLTFGVLYSTELDVEPVNIHFFFLLLHLRVATAHHPPLSHPIPTIFPCHIYHPPYIHQSPLCSS